MIDIMKRETNNKMMISFLNVMKRQERKKKNMVAVFMCYAIGGQQYLIIKAFH